MASEEQICLAHRFVKPLSWVQIYTFFYAIKYLTKLEDIYKNLFLLNGSSLGEKHNQSAEALVKSFRCFDIRSVIFNPVMYLLKLQ